MFEPLKDPSAKKIVDALGVADLGDLRDTTITIRIDHDGNVQKIEQRHIAYVRKKKQAPSCTDDE